MGAARRFPLIFPALADGRIHLTAVSLLARRLTEENAEALLASAFHKTKREIQLLIAGRFPQPDLPTFMERLGAAPATAPCPPGAQGPPPVLAAQVVEVAAWPVHSSAPARIDVPPVEVATLPVHSSAPARIDLPPPCVTPLAPGRFAWQLTVGEERKDLQFDRVEPYARGGAASIGGIRLLCRAHNSIRGGARFRRRAHAPPAGGGSNPRIGRRTAKAELGRFRR